MIGAGPVLLHSPPLPLGHLVAEWENAANRDYLRGLADGLTLVRYDGRGSGLSDRHAEEYSQRTCLLDIEAVAGRIDRPRFALLGFGHAGSVAIAYAAAHPDRVSHLILWHSYARSADVLSLSRIEAARSLIQRDWNSYTELEGYRVSGWRGGDAARWYTEYIKQSVTPEGLAAAYASIANVDVSEMLGRVQARTLVMARRGSEVLPIDIARDLTARIPDARLITFEGSGVIPFPDIRGSFLEAIHQFLLETPELEPGPAQEHVRSSALTPRETEILRLIAAGRTSSEISRELSLSIRTVGRHITNIYGKIGARTRADATAHAIRQRLI